mmetsp:Transcript_101929/g.242992  ORF Transcript_101929/g.242992 Transcript_101929/m.242992 type:complete len:101 (+) Transcript_101929:451-753(+)
MQRPIDAGGTVAGNAVTAAMSTTMPRMIAVFGAAFGAVPAMPVVGFVMLVAAVANAIVVTAKCKTAATVRAANAIAVMISEAWRLSWSLWPVASLFWEHL